MLFWTLLFLIAPVVIKSTLIQSKSESSFSSLIKVRREGATLNLTRISISLFSVDSPLAKDPNIPTLIG
jgi:hypothetical protein